MANRETDFVRFNLENKTRYDCYSEAMAAMIHEGLDGHWVIPVYDFDSIDPVYCVVSEGDLK